MSKKILGLIGFPLSQSFSKAYFTERFEKEGIDNYEYHNFPIKNIGELPNLIIEYPELKGLNVTIPYKKEVIDYLDFIDEGAAAIGAVNCIKIVNGKLKGYNTDTYGFKKSLVGFLDNTIQNAGASFKALVLGSGGASLAVQYVLQKLNIEYKVVSRSVGNEKITYDDLNEKMIAQHKLIINTTPLGMTPNIESCPKLPYQAITPQHYLYDLVYNPSETLFLKNGKQQGAKTINGYNMLIYQAERNWTIFEIA